MSGEDTAEADRAVSEHVQVQVSTPPWIRYALVTAGLLAFTVAVITAPIPGFPSSLFLLVAVALLARSSPRLEQWVRSRPILGRWIHQIEGAAPWQRLILGVAWLIVLAGSAWWFYR